MKSTKRRALVVSNECYDAIDVVFEKAYRNNPFTPDYNDDSAWAAKKVAAQYGYECNKSTLFTIERSLDDDDIYLVKSTDKEAIAFDSLHVGDVVEMVINEAEKEYTCRGTVLVEGEYPEFALSEKVGEDYEYFETDYPTAIATAKRLGIEVSGSNVWSAFPHDTIITKVVSTRDVQEDVLPGERVEFMACLPDQGSDLKPYVGTVIANNASNGTDVILDDGQPAAASMLHYVGTRFSLDAVKKLGLPTDKGNYWSWFGKESAYVSKRLPPIPVEGLKVGDKVRLRVECEGAVSICNGTVVGEATDLDVATAILDEDLPGNITLDNWEEGWTEETRQAASKLGLKLTTLNVVSLAANRPYAMDTKVIAVVGKHEHNWKQDLQVGDRIDTSEGHATIIGATNAGEERLYRVCIDTPRKHEANSFGGQFKLYKQEAEALGLTITTYNWNGLSPLHILAKLPPVDPSTLQAGDRVSVLIETRGERKVILGTITSGDGIYCPQVLLDEEHPICTEYGDGNEEPSGKDIAHHRQSAKKLGLKYVDERATGIVNGIMSGDPYTIEVLQVISKHKTALDEGDAVEFDHSTESGTVRVAGRVLDKTTGLVSLVGAAVAGAVVLSVAQKAKAKALGEEATHGVYLTDQRVIKKKAKAKALGEEATHGVYLTDQRVIKSEPMKIPTYDKLRVGDHFKFTIDIDEDDDQTTYEGTVVLDSTSNDDGDAVIAIKGTKADAYAYTPDCWGAHELIDHHNKQLKLKSESFIGTEDITITKMISRAPEKDEIDYHDLKPGDRFTFTVDGIVRTGTALCLDEDGLYTVYVDEEVNTDYHVSHSINVHYEGDEEEGGLSVNRRRSSASS